MIDAHWFRDSTRSEVNPLCRSEAELALACAQILHVSAVGSDAGKWRISHRSECAGNHDDASRFEIFFARY